MKFKTLALSLVSTLLLVSTTSAREPSWWGVVIARGEDKDRIEAKPILNRPYRPLHVYGNTVRRKYYRGHPVPLPRDVVRGTGALLFRRKL